MQKNNLAIILSGGLGTRFRSSLPKQFHKINNLTLLQLSINKFSDSKLFTNIIVVSHKNLIANTKELVTGENINIVEGGISRQKSVQNGLNEAKKYSPENICIHDAVRPFFSINLLKEILKKLDKYDGVIPSINVYDSVRYILKRTLKILIEKT